MLSSWYLSTWICIAAAGRWLWWGFLYATMVTLKLKLCMGLVCMLKSRKRRVKQSLAQNLGERAPSIQVELDASLPESRCPRAFSYIYKALPSASSCCANAYMFDTELDADSSWVAGNVRI